MEPSRRRHPILSAYARLCVRFGGETPAIQCWSPTQYRVSYHGWHLHDGAAHGAPSADGKTLEKACEALLERVDREHVDLVRGGCDRQCERRYDASPKARLAGKLLMAFVEECSARVQRWPAWKRGKPPCATDDCEMAVGHPGACGEGEP